MTGLLVLFFIAFALLPWQRLTLRHALRCGAGALVAATLACVAVLIGSGPLGGGTRVAATPPRVVAVAAGQSHSLALREDGTVWAWGGPAGGNASRPSQVAGLANITAIAAGWEHSLALDASGQVWVWGGNSYLQARGSFSASSNPVLVPGPTGVVAIAAGGYHSLAVTSGGVVWAWGQQLAVGLAGTATCPISGLAQCVGTPTQVPGLPSIAAVAAGDQHSVALAQDSSVWAWGASGNGQLGAGLPAPPAYTKVQVPGVGAAVGVAAGTQSSFARLADGTILAWGRNRTQQLGLGHDAASGCTFFPVCYSPLPIADGTLAGVVALDGGLEVINSRDQTVALKSDGTVLAWGSNLWGGLGDDPLGTVGTCSGGLPCRAAAGQVGGLPVVAAVSAGRHVLALDANGEVWAWGANEVGQLGRGSNSTTGCQCLPTPAKVQFPAAILSFTPAALSFGEEVVTGTSAARTITVRNTGTAPGTIVGTAVQGDFARTSDCPAVLAANATCTLTVTFTPTATGARTGTLTVTSDAQGSPQAIPLDGVGALMTLTLNTALPSPGALALNPDTGWYTTPGLTYTLKLANPSNQARSYSVSLSATGPRYFFRHVGTAEDLTDSSEDIVVPAGSIKTVPLLLWVKPSTASTLVFTADAFNANTGPLQSQASPVQVPLAQIRPVVVVAGFASSFWDFDGPTRKLVLDPIQFTYEGLLRELRLLGYEDRKTIIEFPWQWYGSHSGSPGDAGYTRGDIESVAATLDTTLTTWWAQRGPCPAYVTCNEFDIITHSTGGLVARQYVKQYGGGKVHSIFMVASPNQGTPLAYGALEGIDFQFGADEADQLFFFLAASFARKAGCYDEFKAFLLPSITTVPLNKLYAYLHGQECVRDVTNVGLTGTTHQQFRRAQPGVPILGQLLPTADAQGTTPYLRLPATNSFVLGPDNPFLNTLNSPQEVESFVTRVTGDNGRIFYMHGDRSPTLERFDVETDQQVVPLWLGGQRKPSGWTSYDPSFSNRRQGGYRYAPNNGDDTVQTWSGDFARILPASLSTTDRNRVIDVDPGLTEIHHVDYFRNRLALPLIVSRLLTYEPTQPFVDGIPQIAINQLPIRPDWQQGLVVVANMCPVTMLITDPQGRRLGTAPDGTVYREIPGGFYSGHDPGDGPDLLWFPNLPGTYTVTVTGQTAGDFQIEGRVLSSERTGQFGFFNGNLQPGQSVTYTTTTTALADPRRFLVVDDGAGTIATDLYRDLLAQRGRPATTWSVSQRGLPTPTDLATYDVVIWATGSSSSFTPAAALLLRAYAEYGGAVLLAGQNVDAGLDAGIMAQALNVQLGTAAVNARLLQGDDLLSGLTLHPTGSAGLASSAFQPTGNAVPLGRYLGGTSAGAAMGVRVTTTRGQFLTLGFGLEDLGVATEREATFDRLLGWLETRDLPTLGGNAAPQLLAGPNQSGSEGATIQVGATFTDADGANTHTCIIEWDDGTTTVGAVTEPNGATPGQCTGSHVYADNRAGSAPYRVAVIVADSGTPTLRGAAVVPVAVTNVAPTATFVAPGPVALGSTFTIRLNSPQDVAADLPGLQYAFDCGDGAGYGPFGATPSRACTAPLVGLTRTVRGIVRDKDGGETAYTATITLVVGLP